MPLLPPHQGGAQTTSPPQTRRSGSDLDTSCDSKGSIVDPDGSSSPRGKAKGSAPPPELHPFDEMPPVLPRHQAGTPTTSPPQMRRSGSDVSDSEGSFVDPDGSSNPGIAGGVSAPLPPSSSPDRSGKPSTASVPCSAPPAQAVVVETGHANDMVAAETRQEEAVVVSVMNQQGGGVEQRKEDMQQREELEQWEEKLEHREEKLEQWEEKLEHREEKLEHREEDVEQREEAALQRDKRQYDRWLRLMEWESDLRRTHYAVEQGHARLSKWVKEAQLEQANREGKTRTAGDEMRCEKLRLQAKEEVEDNDKRKNDEEKEEVNENEKEEKKERTRGCFGTGWPCYFGLRAAGSSDAWESLNENLLAPQQSSLMPSPSHTPKPMAQEADQDKRRATIKAQEVEHDKRREIIKAQEDDQVWNKRQIGYIFDLGTALGLIFLIRPWLPTGYDRWMLVAFAAVWGVGNVGLPIGMFGTSRFEKNWSRHVGRCLSLSFSLLVIYAIYLLTLHVAGGPALASSLSPLGAKLDSDGWMKIWFGVIAAFVFSGHLISWIRGCCTGGDRDTDPYDG